MSSRNKVKKFNFEQWLKDHKLSQYKQIFIDVNMTNLENLNINNELFAKLITDSRLNGNQSIIQQIIKSIQSLHHKSDNKDDKHLDNHYVSALISNQMNELDQLKINLNHNKQKYNKYFFKQNEDKLLNYIDKIAITKSSINEIFESLQDSL